VAVTDEYRWQGWRDRVGLPEPIVLERCGFCDFAVSAPLEEARGAFEAHVCNRPRPVARIRAGGPDPLRSPHLGCRA
jgi:hypothetical protein